MRLSHFKILLEKEQEGKSQMLESPIILLLLRKVKRNKKNMMRQKTSTSKSKSIMLSQMKLGTEEWKQANQNEFGQNFTKYLIHLMLSFKLSMQEIRWGQEQSM